VTVPFPFVLNKIENLLQLIKLPPDLLSDEIPFNMRGIVHDNLNVHVVENLSQKQGKFHLLEFPLIQMVEAVGIEPTSEDRPDRASTCLVDVLISPGSQSTDRESRPVDPEKNLAPPVPAPREASLFLRRPAQLHRRGSRDRRGCL